MFDILRAILFAIILAGPVHAQSSDGAIRGVISSQIEAFQRDDFNTAFSFASPMIRGLFGTAERFGMMVRQGYPMVWRPADVPFLESRDTGGATYQKVLVLDAAGMFHVLEYQMVQTPEGWQINGVRFVEAPQVGA